MSPSHQFSSILTYLFLDNKVDDGIWIGARRMPSANGNSSEFLWTDGSNYNNGYMNYGDGSRVWATIDAPHNTTGDCVEILSRSSANPGKWSTADCDLKKPFLCSKRADSAEQTFELTGDCKSSLDKNKKYVVYN